MPNKILLVEDEPSVRQLLARALEEAGHEVLTAPGGVTGLNMAMENAVVVANSRMPGMSGAQLIAELRRRKPELPVLHVDDVSQVGQPEHQLPADVPALRKPFHLDDFVVAVDALLRSSFAGYPLRRSITGRRRAG